MAEKQEPSAKSQEPSPKSQEPSPPIGAGKSQEEKKKQEVHVRAVKTKIWHPKQKKDLVFYRGDVIKNPWPELIKLAEDDKKHCTLVLIEL